MMSAHGLPDGTAKSGSTGQRFEARGGQWVRLPGMDGTEPLLQFFAYEHLPDHLRAVSQPFCELAYWVVDNLERNPERTVALRKLLEAKDCAVRSRLFK